MNQFIVAAVAEEVGVRETAREFLERRDQPSAAARSTLSKEG